MLAQAARLATNPKSFWALWGLIGASWQANALATHNGSTGSETTRAVWHTDTDLGKAAFLAAFYTGAFAFILWFPGHIVNKLNESSALISGLEGLTND